MIGKIKIQGVIGIDVKLTDVVTQVTNQSDATSFEVRLNTKGGSVKEGKNIYAYLKSLEQPIYMVGVQNVASIGTVIFMAGDTRRNERGTNFFIHLPSIPKLEGATAQDLEDFAKEMRKIETEVVDFYVKNTNLTKEAVMPLLEQETFLNEEQLFSMGFTTEKESVQVEAVAFLDKDLKSKTDKMNKQTRKNATSIVQMIKNILAGDEAQMKILLTADQKEVEFAEVEADVEIKVGDMALIDGVAPTENVVLTDGRTLVFEDGGKVKEIIPKSEEEETEDTEEVEALKTENAKLKADAETEAEAKAKVEAKLVEVTAQLTKQTKTLKSIEKLQTQMLADDDKEKQEHEKKNEQNKVGDSVNALLDL